MKNNDDMMTAADAVREAVDGVPEMRGVREEADRQVLPEAGAVVMDDAAFEEEERAREEAFHGEPVWKGAVLQPFSIGRESFFYQQRAAVGAPPLEVLMVNENAFLADAIRILYLCSHEPKQYRHLRSRPAVLQERMEEWADAEIRTPEEQLEAVTVALRVFNGSHENEAESVPSGEPGADDELGK